MKKKKYDIFKAIADPSRRKIIQLLFASGTLSITTLAADFQQTRQAVTKHISVLEKAGLVSIEEKGRERFCTAEFVPLKEVFDWVAFYENFWNKKLNSLENYLKQNKKTK